MVEKWRKKRRRRKKWVDSTSWEYVQQAESDTQTRGDPVLGRHTRTRTHAHTTDNSRSGYCKGEVRKIWGGRNESGGGRGANKGKSQATVDSIFFPSSLSQGIEQFSPFEALDVSLRARLVIVIILGIFLSREATVGSSVQHRYSRGTRNVSHSIDERRSHCRTERRAARLADDVRPQ
ncbi:hypothetical protein EDB86DRAFT_866008 [Lactarius hatsudake]|nr:hypothetical protein EDB86DRAFT_866008 [Lactarius hatsudake]